MQHNTRNWKPAAQWMVLNEDDLINVKNNSSISILDKKSGRVYKSSVTGKYSVKNRIEKAEKESGKLFRQLNKELVKAAKKDTKVNNGYISYAAVTRGRHGEDDIYDSVYALIKYVYSSPNPYSEDLVCVKKNVSDSGLCYYVVTNNGDRTFYCNAVTLVDNRIRHLYNFNMETIGLLPIPARTKLDLSAFVLSEEVGEVFFLFSERPFMMSNLEHSMLGDIKVSSSSDVAGVICIFIQ